MKAKAFLKINRPGASAIACLRHWLEVFRDHETYILCDWTYPFPPEFVSVQRDHPSVKIIDSDRSLIEYCGALKGAKHGMATANLTGFVYSKDADAFWMVDADDTQFLIYNFDVVRTKILRAEQVLQERSLDCFSLDFYRNLNNGWTFGLALIRSKCNWQRMQELRREDLEAEGMARNIDTAFHIMGKRGILKLANFVFDGLAFQHLYNNYPAMPHGIYSWHRGKLWDQPLQSDVVVI
jgi:hypothetical protein